jgi:hypothetical protein
MVSPTQELVLLLFYNEHIPYPKFVMVSPTQELVLLLFYNEHIPYPKLFVRNKVF